MSLHSNYERNMKMHPFKCYRQIVYVKIKLYQFMKLHRNVNRTFDTIYKKVTLKKRLKMRLFQGHIFLNFNLFGNQPVIQNIHKIKFAPGL